MIILNKSNLFIFIINCLLYNIYLIYLFFLMHANKKFSSSTKQEVINISQVDIRIFLINLTHSLSKNFSIKNLKV